MMEEGRKRRRREHLGQMKGFGAGPERTWTFVSVLEMVRCLGHRWASTRVLEQTTLGLRKFRGKYLF